MATYFLVSARNRSRGFHRWVLQFVRNFQAGIKSESANVRAPLVGDVVVLLPFPHSVSGEGFPDQTSHGLGHNLFPAEPLNHISLSLHDPDSVGRCFPYVKEFYDRDNGKLTGQNFPMQVEERDPYKIACGQRLLIARRALGYPNRRDFARITMNGETGEDLERSGNRLSKWENGEALVPTWYIEKLKHLFGITLDYIFTGDPSAMRPDLSLKIQQQEQAENDG